MDTNTQVINAIARQAEIAILRLTFTHNCQSVFIVVHSNLPTFVLFASVSDYILVHFYIISRIAI